MTYFAFTSLSTVGFGDYYPVGETEKIFGAFILMFGVAIFSMVMSNFSDILLKIKNINEGLDDSDNLDKFINCIEDKFNNNLQMNKNLKKRIIKFFDYKWNMDKMQAIDDEIGN